MERIVLIMPSSTKKPCEETIEFHGDALDLPRDEPRFPSTGTVGVSLQAVKDGYMLTGHLRIGAEMDCSRCLEPLAIDIDESFRHLLSHVSLGVEHGGEWSFLPRDGMEFDLAPLIRELILVALPTKPLCSHDCKGICSKCGTRLYDGPCECDEKAIDPRWMELSTLVADDSTREIKMKQKQKEKEKNGSTQEENVKDTT